MKKSYSRWLLPIGLIACGFAIGRYTSEPAAELAQASDAAVPDQATVSTPISVEMGPADDVVGSAVDPAAELAALNSTLSPTAQRCVGTWSADTSHGPRVSTLSNDGTGVIHAELDWMAAMFYGKKLTLYVDWVIDEENQVMIHTVTSGTPKKNVAALLRDFGSIKEYDIRELEGDTMVLVDPGDGEVITWRRGEVDDSEI